MLTPILFISLCINIIALAFTSFNALTMRIIRPQHGLINESVDICIPLRNESDNVIPVIESALNQTELAHLRIFALDDFSSDDTAMKLTQFSDRIALPQARELPQGWLGKVHACHQLAAVGDGEYLVFTDADVRLHRQAISAAINTMRKMKWDFISPYPRELTGSFLEILIQPLLQWSWMASMVLRLAEKFPTPVTTVANGQLFIVRRAAYESIGGHSAIKEKVLDDLELARALVRAGFRGSIAEGSQIAECRMYTNTRELTDGYTKSLWTAFGGIGGTISAITLLALSGIVPLVGMVNGAVLGWFSFWAGYFSRLIAAIRTGSTLRSALLHPLSISILIVLIGLSWWRKIRGTIQWRGRLLTDEKN